MWLDSGSVMDGLGGWRRCVGSSLHVWLAELTLRPIVRTWSTVERPQPRAIEVGLRMTLGLVLYGRRARIIKLWSAWVHLRYGSLERTSRLVDRSKRRHGGWSHRVWIRDWGRVSHTSVRVGRCHHRVRAWGWVARHGLRLGWV